MHQLNDFSYSLTPNLIANHPANPRDTAKLMMLRRHPKTLSHHIFKDIIHFLSDNDVLVLNNTKVFPARLIGTKLTGGKTEILLLKPLGNDVWEAIGKNLNIGHRINFSDKMTGEILDKNPASGTLSIRLEHSELIDQVGITPIPPYIDSSLPESKLRQEYQTVYAKNRGSAAAPTAGMHFTTQLLNQLAAKGVQIEQITLHVGAGTFAKLKPENLATQTLHHESYLVDLDVADRLNQAKLAGKRIIAVGTTTCRALESATKAGVLISGSHSTNLFIMPPYRFKFTDALITNFHLPESSLLMLVTAFCGYSTFKNSFVDRAYQTAIENNYRFFSFGDAMMIE